MQFDIWYLVWGIVLFILVLVFFRCTSYSFSHMYKRVHSDKELSLRNPLNYNEIGAETDGMLPLARSKTVETKSTKLLPIDRKAFFILVILYVVQGVPLGLAFGSVPLILKAKLLFTEVGLFSLASYPYSLKLLWSPIVDVVYLKKIGRRRLWIIPVQIVSGLTLVYLSFGIDTLLDSPTGHVRKITWCFLLLIFFCATQDIAVDGWALTVLLPESLSFALTAQTVGINCGYYFSYTLFLTLSSPDFANKYIRSVPSSEGLVTMGGYLRFWGVVYLVVTAFLYFVPEDPPHLVLRNAVVLEKNEDGPAIYTRTAHPMRERLRMVRSVYMQMFEVLRLPNVRILICILLVAKVGFQANEAATNLKLVEKGLSKEDLSLIVLINFPFEMLFSYTAGRWSNGKMPLRPWIIGFAGKLVSAMLAQLLVYFFPADGKVGFGFFCLISAQHLFQQFMATIQFVSLCAFFTKIADPAIGGTYMTTLNTLSNYGGTWPRLLVFMLIDRLSSSVCLFNGQPQLISDDGMKMACNANGGSVVLQRDGYYYANILCVVVGTLVWWWTKRKVTYLQSLPATAWRVLKD